MANKSKFLKNILTSVSAAAIVASAGSAYAGGQKALNVNTPANLTNNGDFVGGAALANNDHLLTNTANQVIRTGGFNQTISSIEIAAAGGSFEAGHNVKIGSIFSRNSTQTTLKFTAGVNVTLNGTAGFNNGSVANTYTALKTVDFGNQAATLTISGTTQGTEAAPVIIASSFTGSAAGGGNDNGTIVVDNGYVQFNGTFSQTDKVNDLVINDGKAAVINTSDSKFDLANDITIGSGAAGTAKLIVNAGKNVTVGDIKGDAADKGQLIFKGTSTVASKIGNAAKLNKVQLGAGQVNFTTDVYKATTTELTDAASDIKLSAGGAIAAETNITTTANNQGKVTLDNQDVTFKGSIGASDKKVAEVNLADKQLYFQGAEALELHATNIVGNAANSAIKIKSNNFVFDAVLGSANAKAKEVLIESADGGGAAIVQLKDGSEVHVSDGIDLANANVDNELHLYNTTINGDIITGNNGKGKVVVKGDASIQNIAINGASLIDTLVFDTADKTLTVAGKNLDTTNGIDFKVDAALDLTSANSVTINKAITIAQNADGLGTIKANALTSGQSLKFDGAVGDVAVADKKLKLLEVKGGGTVDFQGSAAVAKIDLGTADSTVALSNNGASEYLINELSGANGKGVVSINNDTTLKKGTVLGTADAKRKQISFAGNHDLNLEDGVNIYANEIATAGANQGKLNILGDAIIDAVIGENTALNDIQVKGANKTAKFLQKVNITGQDVVIYANSTTEFAGDVVAANIRGNTVNGGTLRFTNAEAKEINAVIGTNGFRLEKFEIAGANLTFKEKVDAGTLVFTKDAKKDAMLTIEKDQSLDATVITTASTAAKQGILFDKLDYEVEAAVGTEANPFGYMKVSEGANNASKTLKVSVNDFYADVLTANHENNAVEFNSADAKVRNIGSEAENFKSATFKGAKTTVSGNAWAKDMLVEDKKKVSFAKKVSGAGAFKFDNGSEVTVKDGGTWAIEAAANNANQGILIFEGDATVSNVIGSTALSKVEFKGDGTKKVALNANVAADNIKFGAAKLNVSETRELEGATDFNGTHINLGNNKIELKGANSQFSGAPKISINVDENGASAAQILVTGMTLDMNQATALTIDIDDKSQLPDSTGRSIELIKKNDNAANITSIANNKDVTVSKSRNGFVNWNFDRATNVLSQKNVAVDRLKGIVASKNNSTLSKDAEVLGNADNTGNAKAFVSDMSNISDDKKIAEAVERLTTPIQSTTAIAEQISDQIVERQIRSRMAALAAPTPGIQTADAGITGVSAGDEHYLHGAWVMPFYSSFEQKTRNDSPGYDANSYGVTLGADTQVNADLTLGLAATYSKTDVKHKDSLSADKTKGDTYMFSMYAIQQLTDNWFLQGSASLGSTSFKNTQKRITSAADQTAGGKFDASVYGGELLAGYDYHVADMKFTPMAGLSFNRFNDNGYTETGTSFQNLNVKKKSSNRLEAIAGARANFGAADMGEMELIPEIHGFVRHDFISKDNKVSLSLDGIKTGNIADKKHKPNDTHVNLGAGLTGKSDEFEYGIGYDVDLASKFVGHQGSLKFRVNF